MGSRIVDTNPYCSCVGSKVSGGVSKFFSLLYHVLKSHPTSLHLRILPSKCQKGFFRISFRKHKSMKSVRERPILVAVRIAKFGPLREPIRCSALKWRGGLCALMTPGAMPARALGSWQVQPCRIGLWDRGQAKAVTWYSRLGVSCRANNSAL